MGIEPATFRITYVSGVIKYSILTLFGQEPTISTSNFMQTEFAKIRTQETFVCLGIIEYC